MASRHVYARQALMRGRGRPSCTRKRVSVHFGHHTRPAVRGPLNAPAPGPTLVERRANARPGTLENFTTLAHELDQSLNPPHHGIKPLRRSRSVSRSGSSSRNRTRASVGLILGLSGGKSRILQRGELLAPSHPRKAIFNGGFLFLPNPSPFLEAITFKHLGGDR